MEYSGAIYHEMNRGDRRQPIFLEDQDRERFLATLGEDCAKTGWQVHVLCLMPNHFHLVAETPQLNLVAGMKRWLGTYTARFNRRHKLFGYLFSGRYKALLVDGSGARYFKTVFDYVHLNLARAGLLKPEQPLAAYRWSSWPEYLKSPGKRPAWLRVDRLLGEYRILRDSAAAGRGGHGLPGNPAQITERIGAEHYGAERLEAAEAKAERIVREELAARRWRESDPVKHAKGDPSKVKLAVRLRAETVVTVKWIAERLGMGTAVYVNNRLYRWRTGILK